MQVIIPLIVTLTVTALIELTMGAPQQNLQYRPRDQQPQQQQRQVSQPQPIQQRQVSSQPIQRQPPAQQQPYRESTRVRGEVIPIVRFVNENDGDGKYHFSYETGNGITHEETGYLANPGTDNEIQTVNGYYQYYDNDGAFFKTTYKADENGFQPEGDHLPTPPPIPPEIQKALAIIYAAAAKQQKQATNDNRNRY